ncbi:XdhC family protein [Wenjunlia tyrosinilytica]|uniref:Xanthine dehydrogenase n=1 Tax=Wenjunlia tyrosinilytica TaxID=1544741 RepID=A0A917ZX71_9ACTN|nr:XdhC/CoxI family protein [Wenjunlia tyrosinilytica]GGO96572.1 xanthine dehydrogenase [Wenjunlia tyrosinilytica]
MRELLDDLERWFADGAAFALATVISTQRSAPRETGAVMAVRADGRVLGSVSGGCVEGAVYELAREVLATGRPETAAYGVSDIDAAMVGLTCGGTIEVFVEPVDPAHWPDFRSLARALRAGARLAVATVVRSPDPVRVGTRAVVGLADVGSGGRDGRVVDAATTMLEYGESGLVRLGADGPERVGVLGDPDGTEVVFVRSCVPAPALLVFGSNVHAAAVAQAGSFAGFRVTVCDARAVFTTAERFPDADEVVVDWPDRYWRSVEVSSSTAVCVLTHDPKFDVPVLVRALRSPAGYVGAMGSRRAHADRLERLREAGVGAEELSRLHSPIGLDLGARTPQETAIAVLAEIIKCRRGGSGEHLARTTGPIHTGAPAMAAAAAHRFP